MFHEIHFKEIASTHQWAETHKKTLPTGMHFVTADFQTNGYGRRGTKWLASPNTNLLGTFIVPSPKLENQSNLAQLLAYSTIQILETYPLLPLFKWPNDLLLSHKKVAGFMASSDGTTALVSIGLNVNMRAIDLDQIDIPSTSLYEELHYEIPLPHLKTTLMKQFESDLSLFYKSGFSPFFPHLQNKLAFKGKTATVSGQTGTITGLSLDGRLILSQNNHETLISSGHLTLLP